MSTLTANGNLDDLLRTLRLAHAQLANIKNNSKATGSSDKSEQIDNIELLVELLVKKVEDLRTK